MSNFEFFLVSCIVAVLSGYVGNVVGRVNKVSEDTCSDHRSSCSKLLCQKIDALSKRVDDLKISVDKRISI